MNRLLIASLGIAVLAATLVPRLFAQDATCIDALSEDVPQQIGCVNRILEKRWIFFDRTVPESDGAEIRRLSTGAEPQILTPIHAADPLSNRDRLRLDNSVNLELWISDETTRSRVVLERGGLWELRRDTVPRLVITHGQMVVNQIEGQLEAYLENVLNVIHATTVYYDVDSTSGESFVFLKEGHMSFPEFGIDVRGSDSLWVLRDGVAPQAVPATSAMIRRWSRREDHASRSMWQTAETPIIRRPKFWLLAGGVAVGATLLDCALTHIVCGGSDYTSGEYQIPIP